MTACPHCGAQMADGRSVCKACGKLSTASVEPNAPVSRGEPPAAAKKGINPLIVVALSILVVVCIVGGLGNVGRSRPSVPAASSTVRVDYVITGTADRASLTYTNASGGTEQKDVILPWEDRLEVRRGAFVYISAQNKGERGSVTCKILVDLTTYKESTSEGAYKIASCSGKA